jgi:hypothetical protein
MKQIFAKYLAEQFTANHWAKWGNMILAIN